MLEHVYIYLYEICDLNNAMVAVDTARNRKSACHMAGRIQWTEIAWPRGLTDLRVKVAEIKKCEVMI